jgi:3-hydroxyisobutyrate dehydrogenase-like beta-hydroxyacid dehydrogenase
VGIGIMGLPMAKNLLKAGYELTVWNRSGDKCAPLAEAGARVARESDTALSYFPHATNLLLHLLKNA